jgi:hypothetical protein
LIAEKSFLALEFRRPVVRHSIILMSVRDIIVAAIWISFLAGAFYQGRSVPYSQIMSPLHVALFIFLLFFVFALAAAFFQRRHLVGLWPGRS